MSSRGAKKLQINNTKLLKNSLVSNPKVKSTDTLKNIGIFIGISSFIIIAMKSIMARNIDIISLTFLSISMLITCILSLLNDLINPNKRYNKYQEVACAFSCLLLIVSIASFILLITYPNISIPLDNNISISADNFVSQIQSAVGLCVLGLLWFIAITVKSET